MRCSLIRRTTLVVAVYCVACAGSGAEHPQVQVAPHDAGTTEARAENRPADGEHESEGTDVDAAEPSPAAQALEACRSARELLDRHDTPAAIREIDRAYELLLSLPEEGDE